MAKSILIGEGTIRCEKSLLSQSKKIQGLHLRRIEQRRRRSPEIRAQTNNYSEYATSSENLSGSDDDFIPYIHGGTNVKAQRAPWLGSTQ